MSAATPDRPPGEDPGRFELRGRPRPVVRFRRAVVAGGAGVLTMLLAGVTWFALEPPAFRSVADGDDPRELAAPAAPDALAGAPENYGEVPRLGPPLPGDLGRPILESQRGFEAEQAAGPGEEASAERVRQRVEAERDRIEAERMAARQSALFVRLSDQAGRAPVEGAAASMEASGAAANPLAVRPDSGGRDTWESGAFASPPPGGVSPHALEPPPSPWVLSAGTVIQASLLTGLNSEVPGLVLAQVTADVRDSPTGRTVLVPQGARLVGSYESVVAFGQRRALVVWTRLVLPDGSSIALDNVPAADAAGYAGLEDRVDMHSWRLLKGIALSTLLGVGTELSLGGESDLVRAVREATQQNAARAGDRITSRNLDVQPTITVRPGWPVRAIIHRDLVLRPWRG